MALRGQSSETDLPCGASVASVQRRATCGICIVFVSLAGTRRSVSVYWLPTAASQSSQCNQAGAATPPARICPEKGMKHPLIC